PERAALRAECVPLRGLGEAGLSWTIWWLPNGSRLSCGRNARWRKAVEGQKKARRRGNAILPTRAPASFKRMLGARRRGIECRSTCDVEGSHIRPGSGRVDRVVENDVLPLKLGVEENDSCYPVELVTGA